MRIAEGAAPPYNDEVNLREARSLYFEENDFGEDGGYSKPTATVYLFGFPVAFPNTEGRKRAVVFHDFHHVLTGYKTNNMGESEISAWELGSGCSSYPFALAINTLGLLLGIFRSPRRILRAFVRGRSTQNVYGRDVESLLAQELDSLRDELGLNAATRTASLWELVVFFGYLSVALFVAASPLLGLVWLFW